MQRIQARPIQLTDMDTQWIAFEGGDGVGKTTQTALFANRMIDNGLSVFQTRAPGGTEVGKMIRQLLVQKQVEMNPLCEEMLHAADMAQLCEKIDDVLYEGTWVVSDRSVYSSYAYSTRGKQNHKSWEALFDMACPSPPDLVIVLDMDRVEAKTRSQQSRGEDVIVAYDNAGDDFNGRIQAYFKGLAVQDPQRVVIVNVDGLSVEEAHEKIWGVFLERTFRRLADDGLTFSRGI